MTEILCPCCNRPMEGKAVEVDHLLDLGISGVRMEIIDKLVTAYPKSIRSDVLYEYVYAFADDPPELSSLIVMVSKMRKSLRQHGWTIKNTQKGGRGNVACYRLEPVNE